MMNINTAAKSAAPPKTQVCQFELKKLGKNIKQARKSISKFSPLKKGGFSQICKTCRCQLSREWTTARADFRKEYHKALQLIKQGKKIRVPKAKTWKKGDPLRFTNGQIYREKAVKETAATV